ncbi:transposase [Klebsiella pneumoniae]|nr:transposase [Klebsiella pneumoniae]
MSIRERIKGEPNSGNAVLRISDSSKHHRHDLAPGVQRLPGTVGNGGRWAYLYRAVDSRGRTVDFYLSSRRNSKARWYWRNPSDLCPWHMDETYVKVNGRWAYLYRAVDSRGRTVDFYLSSRRNSKAAYRFLGKILNNVKKWQIPRFINTDKAPAYGRALALLKREGRCPSDVEHRQIKYRNNVIECDHGKLKRIIGATLGFKSMKTAYATIKGIEVMRALRKGQASAFYYGDPLGEMRLVSRVFEM